MLHCVWKLTADNPHILMFLHSFRFCEFHRWSTVENTTQIYWTCYNWQQPSMFLLSFRFCEFHKLSNPAKNMTHNIEIISAHQSVSHISGYVNFTKNQTPKNIESYKPLWLMTTHDDVLTSYFAYMLILRMIKPSKHLTQPIETVTLE